jgi:lipoprotein-anchoring transpeptidase ErfK/SrfK
VLLRVVRTTAVLLVLVAVAALAVALTRQPTVETDVATVAARVPCRASARACVRLSTNQAWLLRNGRVILGPVTISHGKAGFRTPPGVFRVSFKDIDHRSSIFHGAPMPYSVFFNGGIAFHAGNTGQKSHGCVRLNRAAARTFYNTLRPGDVVQVVP